MSLPNATAPQGSKNVWLIFVLGLLLIALFAIVGKVLITSGDRSLFDEEAIRAKERLDILAQVQNDNAAATTGYDWVDRDKGIVRIPVARAVELFVVRSTIQDAPRAANKIDPATSQGSTVKPGGFAAPTKPIPPFPTPAPIQIFPATQQPEPAAAPAKKIPEAAAKGGVAP